MLAATYQPISVAPDGKAVVYVYRPYQGFNAAGWPNIYVDGKKIFALKNKGYGVLYVEPGHHEIKAEGSMFFTNWYPGPMDITHYFEQGKEYYIRVTPSMSDALFVGSVVAISGKASVTVVPNEQAVSEIASTKRIVEKQI